MTVESRIRLVNPALEGMFGVAERICSAWEQAAVRRFTGAQRFRDAAALQCCGGGVFNDESCSGAAMAACSGPTFTAGRSTAMHPEIGTIALIGDIGCRRRAEAQLKRSEELNRTIIETCCRWLRIIRCRSAAAAQNPAMRIMLGYDLRGFCQPLQLTALLGMPSGLW